MPAHPVPSLTNAPRRYKDRRISMDEGNGRIWIAMISPPTPDCRGGVFAVFAKIPPPVPFLTIMPIPCFPDCRPPMGTYGLYYGTPHRYGLREMELLD